MRFVVGTTQRITCTFFRCLLGFAVPAGKLSLDTAFRERPALNEAIVGASLLCLLVSACVRARARVCVCVHLHHAFCRRF